MRCRKGGQLHIAVDSRLRASDPPKDGAWESFVVISVSDTGSGMDEETAARAAEPFFSTKGIGKGTGLGLSMVHGLAEQFGGAVHIRSAIGEGTCVEVMTSRWCARPSATCSWALEFL